MVAALQKRPLSPWEEGLRAGKVPIILPVQSPAPPADSEEDDVETFVPRDAIFPSRHVDIDALYATEVSTSGVHEGAWIGLSSCERGASRAASIHPISKRDPCSQVTAATARQALRDIRLLIHDDRLIAAATLLEKLERFLATACGDDSDNTALRRELEGRMARPRVKRQLEVLRERAVECREAAEDLSSVRAFWCWGVVGWGVCWLGLLPGPETTTAACLGRHRSIHARTDVPQNRPTA